MENFYITSNVEETELLAYNIAKGLKKGDIIGFYGGLGNGKTAFVRGLASGLEIDCVVSSPTYSLVNEYIGNIHLCHFDMYRINNLDDLYTTGFFDYIETDFILAIEWFENIENFFKNDIIKIKIEVVDENKRKITITGEMKVENTGY